MIECPILRKCISHLLVVDKAVPKLRLDDEIAELEDICARASSSLEYTRLRGFVIIETMLQHLESKYTLQYKAAHTPNVSLVLSERTWSALGRAKKELKTLLADVQLEFGDYQLSGDKRADGTLVIRPQRSDEWKRMAAMDMLSNSIPILIATIDRYRPALRSASTQLSSMVVDFHVFTGQLYGTWQPDRLVSITRDLAQLRI